MKNSLNYVDTARAIAIQQGSSAHCYIVEEL